MKYYFHYYFEQVRRYMTLVSEDDKIISLQFGKNILNLAKEIQTPTIKNLRKELDAYFSGKLFKFQTKYHLKELSDFEKDVYDSLISIPYGKLKSYKEIANDISRKNSYRAVGNAISKNPILILIPCHRVIKSNGQIGNYMGGFDMKKTLIEIERENLF